MTTAVLYGSVREQRKGIRAAKYICDQLRGKKHTVHFIDPMEYSLPLLNKRYKEYEKGSAPENMEKVANLLHESDGYIIVTGEYNHSIPPALKNLLDHFQKEYFFKPSGIVSYSAGSFGGVRAAIQLRAVLAELGTPSIPNTLPIPKVQDAFDEKGGLLKTEVIQKSTDKFLKEYEWYLSAFKTQREKGTPY